MENESQYITKKYTPEGVKFFLEGFICSLLAKELQEKLKEALENGENKIILNMLQVEYVCSIGISIILNTYKAAKKAGGILKIEEPSENVRKVLAITSLDELLIQ